MAKRKITVTVDEELVDLAHSFGEEKLAQNIRAFVEAVNRAKPPGAKGSYLLRAAISSTMGPGVRLDLATLQTAAGA